MTEASHPVFLAEDNYADIALKPTNIFRMKVSLISPITLFFIGTMSKN